MATKIMMYILPMMLGKTYDMAKDNPGIQIFSDTVTENSTRIEHYFTDSQYRMVDNSKDIRNFLNVEGKLSLKIKGGMIDISGEGSYLKDSASRDNTVEILVKVNFETVTFTIPSSVKPRKGALEDSAENKKFLGTHYCRSITYGGNLIASIRFVATNRLDKERIKGAIQGELNAKGIDAEVKGQLEKLTSEVQDSSSMEIDYYSTVPIPGVAYNIEGLMKLVNDFPEHVKKVNDGLGNPLRMELYPLSSLENTFSTYYENKALNDELSDLEDQFDDIRMTKREISNWINSLPPHIPENVQNQVEKFVSKIEDIYAVYIESIGNLDLGVGATRKPFDDAFRAYEDGGNRLPGKYMRAFKNLLQKIYKEAPELKPKNGGATYVHWGKSSCNSSDDIENALSGVATASENQQEGGSSEFICMPNNPLLNDPKDFSPAFEKNEMYIGPIRYRGPLHRFRDMFDKKIACSVCRVRQRSAVVHLYAMTICPEGWIKEYQGLLMAPGKFSNKGQYVCIDTEMETPLSVAFGNDVESYSAEIQEVTVHCGSLPCGPYKSDAPIPCVVCTR